MVRPLASSDTSSALWQAWSSGFQQKHLSGEQEVRTWSASGHVEHTRRTQKMDGTAFRSGGAGGMGQSAWALRDQGQGLLGDVSPEGTVA